MASVRKRNWTYKGQKKEAWVVTYTDPASGKRIQGGTFERKKDADKERLRVEQEIEAGIHTAPRETVLFQEACNGWTADCERRWRIGDRMTGLSLYKNRSHAKNHLLPKLGNRRISDIDFLAMQDLVNSWSECMAKGTVADLASCLKMVLNYAVERGWIKYHALTHRKLHIPGRKNKRQIPSKEEIRLILQAIVTRRYRETERGHRARALLVTLAIFGGLRRGEICGLQWENVDFGARIIHVRHSLSRVDGLKDPKSKAGIRTVTMTEPMQKVLEWARGTDCIGLGYVVRSADDRALKPEHVYRYWLATMDTAGLTVPATTRKGKSKTKEKGLMGKGVKPKYPFHSLRHAAASLLIEQGLLPMHVKAFIGHSSVNTTFDIYGHLFPEDESSRIAAQNAAGQFKYVVPHHRPTLTRGRQESDKTFQITEK